MQQHIVINPGSPPEARQATLTYSAIATIVGFPMRIINLREGEVVMYVPKDDHNLPTNEWASLIAREPLRGTALLIGPLEGGRNIGLTDEQTTGLLHEGQMAT